MKAALALFAVAVMLIGRILTYKASKAAWDSSGSGSATPLDKINSDPKLKAMYRLGQGHYIVGAVMFGACFLL
jgi:hypothetical protein